MWSVSGGSQNLAALLAWIATAVALAGSVAAALLTGLDQVPGVPWKQILLPLMFSVPGALIAAGRPRIAVGWLMLAVALLFAGAGLGQAWVGYAAAEGTDRGVAWAVWFTDRFSAFLVPCGWLSLILLPDGRLPARRWRPLVWTVGAVQVVALVIFVFARGAAAGPDSSFPDHVLDLANPVGVLPSVLAESFQGYDALLLQLPLLLCPLAFVVRLRGAASEDRTRIVGVLLAATVFVLLTVLGHALWADASDVFDIVGSALFAAVLTGAVLRRRLRGIDFAVHHGIVYAVLTALIAGLYVAASTLAGRLGHDLPPFGAGVVAALLALALLPLRSRLQRVVDRMLYGDRRDPYSALSRLADKTHDQPSLDAVLTEFTASVARSLRVPWARAKVDGLTATWGTRPGGGKQISASLVSGGTRIGDVVVGADASRRLGPADERLLTDLGRHGGMAIHAVMLADAVRASRQRLVESREEEKRRLGRDLHDELGPTIAGLTMQLGALRRLVDTDPATAVARLARLESISRDALEQVRRVARELRPPALDQLGLVEALRQTAESQGIVLQTPTDALPKLPAALEVAAYRIGAEAITNIARHTPSETAELMVESTGDTFVFSVGDAGPGMVEAGPWGVGLLGMRERAEELGGSLTLTSQPGLGTTVTATLPIHRTRETAVRP